MSDESLEALLARVLRRLKATPARSEGAERSCATCRSDSGVVRGAARGRLPTQLTTAGLAYDADFAARVVVERLQRQFEELHAQVQRLETVALGDDDHES